ncbi:unnamed protein product, partial [Ixodes hexagonus]
PQGTFVSERPGEVVAEVDVSEEPVSPPGGVSDVCLGPPSCVLVRANAEMPHLQLEPRRGLRWDALPWASSKHARRFTVANCGSCSVPVRIAICQGERAFSLCVVGEEPCADSSGVRRLLLGSGQATELEVTCSTERVKCDNRSTSAQSNLRRGRRTSGGRPTDARCVTTAGKPIMCTDDGPIPLVVEAGGTKTFRVVNGGAHPLEVELRATPPFCVTPGRVVLEPSLGASLKVALDNAKGPAKCNGVIEAVLSPQGFTMELAELEGVPAKHAAPCCPLEATKRLLFWPGTQVGCSVTKSVMFRNPNSLPMEVSFSVQKHSASQFEASKSFTRICGSGSTCLPPGSSVEVRVAFRPTAVGFAQSRLVISSHGAVSQENKSVQLYGFGGELCLRLEGPPQFGPLLHLLDMGMPLAEGSTARQHFNLANRGPWDCCVCFALDAAARNGPYGSLSVTPERLILRRNESKVVSVSFKFGGCKLNPRGEIVNLGTLRILSGFEALRLRAKQALAGRLKTASLSPDVSLFLETFEGERRSADGEVCVAASLAEEALLKSTCQRLVAVTCGPRPGRLQDSAVAASFATLEDTS